MMRKLRGASAALTALAAASVLVVVSPSGAASITASATTGTAPNAPNKPEAVQCTYTQYEKTTPNMCGTRLGWYAMTPSRAKEYFVIDPNRRILHVWPSAARWEEMPHLGRADDIASAGECIDYRARYVAVYVAGYGEYYSYTRAGWATWTRWARGLVPISQICA